MRQYVIALQMMLLIASSPSLAQGNDRLQFAKTAKMKMEKMFKKEDRTREFMGVKSEVRRRLDDLTYPENLLELPDQHPLVTEVRSLTEFEGYLDQVDTSRIDSKSCQNQLNQIAASAQSITQGDEKTMEGIEARLAYELVQALCKN